ncbi:hypothetical protein GCM10027056_12760 [Glaciibacter psychrotolerans]
MLDVHAQPAEASIGAWSGERTGPFLDGSRGVRARDRRIIAAWAVDMGIVLLVSALAGVGMADLSYSVDVGVFVGIVMVLFFPWLYGFFCVGGNSLGTLIAGTRLVKLRDGSGPGMWRSGWLMFLRTVLFYFVPLNSLLSALNGSTDPVVRTHHVSIDKAETRALQRS